MTSGQIAETAEDGVGLKAENGTVTPQPQLGSSAVWSRLKSGPAPGSPPFTEIGSLSETIEQTDVLAASLI